MTELSRKLVADLDAAQDEMPKRKDLSKLTNKQIAVLLWELDQDYMSLDSQSAVNEAIKRLMGTA